MTEHLVEQTSSTRGVHLRCMDCDFFADLGHQGAMDHEQHQRIAPVATLVRWSHQDPTLVVARTDGEVIEQSTWRRVRQYLVGGQP